MRRNKVTTNTIRQMQSWDMYLRAHGWVAEPAPEQVKPEPIMPVLIPTFTSKIRGIAARVLQGAA